MDIPEARNIEMQAKNNLLDSQKKHVEALKDHILILEKNILTKEDYINVLKKHIDVLKLNARYNSKQRTSNSVSDTQVTLENGKYTFVVREGSGTVECLRSGESWVTFYEGCKALISLIHLAAGSKEALVSIREIFATVIPNSGHMYLNIINEADIYLNIINEADEIAKEALNQ